MTEPEWLTCSDPHSMLKFLGEKASERKLLLFACACCRRLWHLLSDVRSQRAVEVAEDFADGTATSDDLVRASYANCDFTEFTEGRALAATAVQSATCSELNEPGGYKLHPLENADGASRWAAHAMASPTETDPRIDDEFPELVPWLSERAVQATLLRCIFASPFRPTRLDSSCQSSTVVSLAQAIYAEGAYDRLPILADALEDAGWDNADILNHCRQPGDHVRGCWVVDLVRSVD